MPAIKKHSTVIIDVGGNHVEIMLDSASSVSFARRDIILLLPVILGIKYLQET